MVSSEKTERIVRTFLFGAVLLCAMLIASTVQAESSATDDNRMDWWREARFGMFIHWGIYSVPAGEWSGKKGYGEWIMHFAQIPLLKYEKFAGQFDPIKFDAEQWVKLAKKAGMKYLVITSKHHDGFCMWDSKFTDYDIVDATPFKRDVLAELKQACDKYGVKLCFYYSIMDWHHYDYLPRREWQRRLTERADFNRYVCYMKSQLKELIEKYDPAVLWFDGEWEDTWTHEQGKDLYKYIRSLKPDILINNRVDKGRQGMQGLTKEGDYAGDFGTPEQEIPLEGLAGVDWESCMTMNKHWGYNKHDSNWKSTKMLIQNIVDIASKGGNYLLNVGPMANGEFPQPCIERLEGIGKWMAKNSESIYGTSASSTGKLEWGRCTAKKDKLYLHVFD